MERPHPSPSHWPVDFSFISLIQTLTTGLQLALKCCSSSCHALAQMWPPLGQSQVLRAVFKLILPGKLNGVSLLLAGLTGLGSLKHTALDSNLCVEVAVLRTLAQLSSQVDTAVRFPIIHSFRSWHWLHWSALCKLTLLGIVHWLTHFHLTDSEFWPHEDPECKGQRMCKYWS